MASPATIFVWLNRFPEFLEQYAGAKEIQYEILAAEAKEVVLSEEELGCFGSPGGRCLPPEF